MNELIEKQKKSITEFVGTLPKNFSKEQEKNLMLQQFKLKKVQLHKNRLSKNVTEEMLSIHDMPDGEFKPNSKAQVVKFSVPYSDYDGAMMHLMKKLRNPLKFYSADGGIISRHVSTKGVDNNEEEINRINSESRENYVKLEAIINQHNEMVDRFNDTELDSVIDIALNAKIQEMSTKESTMNKLNPFEDD